MAASWNGSLRFVWLLAAIAAADILSEPAGKVQAGEAESTAEAREQSRSTAIALNYCRASFLRIKRNPTKQVLVEEQEKILNNLNLNGIAEEEVIKLYSGVLDEIGQIEIAERERQVLRQRHNDIFAQRMSGNMFVGATQIMSGSVAGAVRTGVNSWWDYRTMQDQKELDSWKVEKARLAAIVDKSSDFLDSFWKLSRSRNIPDNWLVRDDDLEKLELAAREPKLETRLRVLKRMGRFMECYPPYWYYTGRTQQQLGMFRDAEDTYEHLAGIGEGYFRKDDMMASGLANLAALQEASGNPEAPRTAARALNQSTSVWQANLLCAGILNRHSEVANAEDAILRNLDVEIEKDQSRVALTTLYIQSRNVVKLRSWLGDPQIARSLPGPILLQTAGMLGNDCPMHIRQALHLSFYGYTDLKHGQDDVVLMVSREWEPHRARVNMVVGGDRAVAGQVRPVQGGYEIRFPRVAEYGSPWKRDGEVNSAQLVWKYQDTTSMELKMSWVPGRSNYDRGLLTAFNNSGFRGTAGRDALRITHFRVDQRSVSDEPALADHSTDENVGSDSVLKNVSSGSSDTTENKGGKQLTTDGPTAPAADPRNESSAKPTNGAPVQLLPLEPIGSP